MSQKNRNRDISSSLDAKKASKLAKHEVNWWKAHHRKIREQLLEEMISLYVLQFNLDYEDAKTAVEHRVNAAAWHDEAESLEDAGEQEEADSYWDKAEEELRKHYTMLIQLIKKHKQ